MWGRLFRSEGLRRSPTGETLARVAFMIRYGPSGGSCSWEMTATPLRPQDRDRRRPGTLEGIVDFTRQVPGRAVYGDHRPKTLLSKALVARGPVRRATESRATSAARDPISRLSKPRRMVQLAVEGKRPDEPDDPVLRLG